VAIGIILGTGVGGGIIWGGKVLEGRQGGGGEIGHSIFDRFGPYCYCGDRGHTESYLSGGALEIFYQQRRRSSEGNILGAREIFSEAKAGNPQAMGAVAEYKSNMVTFLTNLTNIFDPHYLVFGGGVSLEASIFENLEEKIARRSYNKVSPRLYPAILGDASGGLGAAFEAFRRSTHY